MMMMLAVSGAAAVKVASAGATSHAKKSSNSRSAKKMLATAALVIGSSCVGSASAVSEGDFNNSKEYANWCRDTVIDYFTFPKIPTTCNWGIGYASCPQVWAGDFTPLQAADCYHNHYYGGPITRERCQSAMKELCPNLFNDWVVNCEFDGGCGPSTPGAGNLRATA